MGHFHSNDLCKEANKIFFRFGRITIKEVVDHLVENDIGMSCSEGVYKDPYMLSYGIEEIFRCWHDHGFIEPVKKLMDAEKWNYFNCFFHGFGDISEWEEHDYARFDQIYWQRTPGNYAAGKLPSLGTLTN